MDLIEHIEYRDNFLIFYSRMNDSWQREFSVRYWQSKLTFYNEMQFSMRLEIYSLIDVSRIFIAQPHRRLHVHMYIYISRWYVFITWDAYEWRKVVYVYDSELIRN